MALPGEALGASEFRRINLISHQKQTSEAMEITGSRNISDQEELVASEKITQLLLES